MSLSIYNIQHNQSPKIIQSFFGLNQIVRLAVYKNHFYTDENNKNILKGLPDIYCLLNTNQLSYSFSNTWAEGPGGKLFEKLNDYMAQGMVKLISGVAGEGKYKSFSPTNEWSQRILSETTPLTISLKTKCFHPNYNRNTTVNGDTELSNYKDFIKFLILVTAPNHVTIQDYLKNYVSMLVKINAKNTETKSSTTGNQGEYSRNKDTGMVNRVLNKLSNAIDETSKEFKLSDSADFTKHTRGNFSLVVKTERMQGKQTEILDWIVKNWSFKPSTQNIVLNDVPEPLWIDFTLELETNMALSNMQIYNLFFT